MWAACPSSAACLIIARGKRPPPRIPRAPLRAPASTESPPAFQPCFAARELAPLLFPQWESLARRRRSKPTTPFPTKHWNHAGPCALEGVFSAKSGFSVRRLSGGGGRLDAKWFFSPRARPALQGHSPAALLTACNTTHRAAKLPPLRSMLCTPLVRSMRSASLTRSFCPPCSGGWLVRGRFRWLQARIPVRRRRCRCQAFALIDAG